MTWGTQYIGVLVSLFVKLGKWSFPLCRLDVGSKPVSICNGSTRIPGTEYPLNKTTTIMLLLILLLLVLTTPPGNNNNRIIIVSLPPGWSLSYSVLTGITSSAPCSGNGHFCLQITIHSPLSYFTSCSRESDCVPLSPRHGHHPVALLNQCGLGFKS